MVLRSRGGKNQDSPAFSSSFLQLSTIWAKQKQTRWLVRLQLTNILIIK